MARRPNILWICTDQQRFDTLGCYGNEFVQTPNLDRLAADGMLFRRAYCQNPVCTPSRASFLTGRYPRTTRCRQNGQNMPADEVLVPKILHDAGYVCGLSGKLHVSACNDTACHGTEPRIDDGYDQFFWSHHPGHNWPTNEYYQWVRDQGRELRTPRHPESRFVQQGMSAEMSQAAWCVNKAMSFIRGAHEHRGDIPWLFSVNMFDPHHSFDPPPECLARYADKIDDIPLPNYVDGELDHKPVWQQIDHRGAYGGIGMSFGALSDRDHRWTRAAYWAMVDNIDAQVGRLLDFLDEIGERDNTVIIFTSDHGEMLGDHGIYLKGPYFYECAVHVPLIIAGPGIDEGRQTDALVELTDLAPTILNLCGLPPSSGMQGKSMYNMLTGAGLSGHHRDDVYCEFYGSNFRYDPPAHTTMVATERYKLTVAHGHQFGELYDLEVDPGETTNLWDEPEYAGVRSDMMLRMVDRMAWTADPLPERVAAW